MIDIEDAAGLVAEDGTEMSLQSVKAKGVVNGLLLEMTICQHYKNKTKTNLETVYTFPMGWGASLMDVTVEIGGKRLSGVVTEKKEAELRYEKAITAGDAPIMVEKNSAGLYTLNLGNLKVNEEAVIEYSYSQLLRFEEGSARITLPTAIAPKYGDSAKGGIERHQSTQASVLVEYPFTLSISLCGGMEEATVECPSHQIKVSKKMDALVIELTHAGYLDRDFILNLSQLQNKSFFIVTPDQNIGPNGCTVLASFCPPVLEDAPIRPVNLKILVDCSGSMVGDSIKSAKSALHQILSQLTSQDRFSYSRFGTKVIHDFSELKNVSPLNISAASILIGRTEADMGGTETGQALFSTFQLGKGNDSSDILLITDGAVWDTEEIIRKAKSSGHRIFAIGVGSAPAESLLQKLAEKTNGACELIAPKENIEKTIVRMFNRLRLPRPKDIVIQWDHNEQPLWTTGTDRTIFYGNTSHIFAGFLTPPTRPPILSYQISQEAIRVEVQANSISHSTNKNIPRLGASERLSSESDEYKLALALTYQLITDQTNCILVHVRSDEEKAQGLPELQRIAQMQAAGWGGFGSVHEDAYSSNLVSFSSSRMSESIHPIVHACRSSNISNSSDILPSSDDFYEVPAFLRKDFSSLEMSMSSSEKITKKSDVIPNLLNKYLNKETKPISPSDVIKIANEEIKVPQDITSFIELINKQKMAPELLQVVGNLINKQGVRDAWILILAWLIIRLDEKATWNKLTKDAIEELTNQLDRSKLDDGLQLLTFEMFEVTKDYWW